MVTYKETTRISSKTRRLIGGDVDEKEEQTYIIVNDRKELRYASNYCTTVTSQCIRLCDRKRYHRNKLRKKVDVNMSFGFGFRGMGGMPNKFVEQYHCYSVAYADRAHLEVSL